MAKSTSIVAKLMRLFARYPKEAGVRPQSFGHRSKCDRQRSGDDVLAIQLVADRVFFLLFGTLAVRLAECNAIRVEAVLVRAISGAVGSGWIAELKRSAPIIRLWTNAWVRAFGQSIDGIAYRSANWRHPLRNLTDWRLAGKLWTQLKTQGDIEDFAINGVQVGDLLIDSYLRFKPSPRFNVNDPFVRRLLWQALRDIGMASDYFGRVRPRWYLTSYTCYLEHGIPTRVALREGIEVWAFANINIFGKRLSLSDSYSTRDFSGYRREFESLDRHEERLAQAATQLDNRLAGGIDVATSYMLKSAYAINADQLPEGLAGAVVIFLHDFYDSPHIYPDFIFRDFWDWLCFTIDTLSSTGVKFFLKPHPNQISLSEGAIGQLRENYPALRWLPVTASNVQLARAGVACGLTVYGTVSHELAYMGVPSICCARHPHYQFDFCRTAKSKAQYREMLLSPDVMPVSREEMIRQALAFYYMHNLQGEPEERALQRAFSALWFASSRIEAEEPEILATFRELTALPGFTHFVQDIAGVTCPVAHDDGGAESK